MNGLVVVSVNEKVKSNQIISFIKTSRYKENVDKMSNEKA